MFKAADIKVAVAFVINGYLRANEGEATEDENLQAALTAILRECDDWAEGLNSAKPDIEVSINGARSPYNLRKAVEALKVELEDLDGGIV